MFASSRIHHDHDQRRVTAAPERRVSTPPPQEDEGSLLSGEAASKASDHNKIGESRMRFIDKIQI